MSISAENGRSCKRSGQDNVTLGNSFVPSYFRPLRKIPYMACSNFLATAVAADPLVLRQAAKIREYFTHASEPGWLTAK